MLAVLNSMLQSIKYKIYNGFRYLEYLQSLQLSRFEFAFLITLWSLLPGGTLAVCGYISLRNRVFC